MPFKYIKPEPTKWGADGLKPCRSANHDPPTMICLPPGRHIWVCPECGYESAIYIPEVTCDSKYDL